MASIKKIEGKTGTSFKITVTKGRDSNGKQIRHFKTWTPDRPMTPRQMEKEVQRVALDFEREIDLGFQADNRQTFEQYVNYFIQLREKRGTAKGTIERYHSFMKRIGPIIGHLKLQDIRPQHLNNFYQELEKPGTRDAFLYRATPRINFRDMLKEKGLTERAVIDGSHIAHSTMTRICNGGKVGLKKAEEIAAFLDMKVSDLFTVAQEHNDIPLTATTIRDYHSFICAVLGQAEKEMLIPYNPAKRATPPAAVETAPNYFQPETLARILEALEDEPPKWKTLIHLLVVTGCRRGEIAGLKWEKIDFARKEIKIDRSLQYLASTGAIEGPTKTRNTRYISIPDETVSLLRKYKQWQAEQKLKNGDRWKGEGYLFTQDDGRPIVPGTINGWLNRFARNHGLPHINPHAFRHTAASILISEGVDIVTVSKMLGHANTSMTTDVYSHIIEETKRKATECIADVMLRKKKA